jgi:predicted PurR-regulated permease PerM
MEKKGFLILLLAVISVGFFWVVLPLFGAIMWAVCFAILFDSMNRRLARRLSLGPNLAALLSTALVLLLVVLPGILCAGFIVQEASGVLQRIRSGDIDLAGYYQQAIGLLPRWLADLLQGAGFNNLPSLMEKLRRSATEGTQPIASRIWTLGQNTLDFSVNFLVMIYLLFFLFRDGEALLVRIRRAVPLEREVQRQLIDHFSAVIRSTVKGNVIVAMVQGVLGGIALMAVGVPAALLWTVVMAFLSLLPAVGAALVWGPVALYLLLNGQTWQGLSLIAFGALVIGLVDNLLRPMLVGKQARMPDYVVLVSTIGGMSLFGINGFVIGPTIAALFIAIWNTAAEQRLRQSTE